MPPATLREHVVGAAIARVVCVALLASACGPSSETQSAGLGPAPAGLWDCSAPDALTAETVIAFASAIPHDWLYTPLPLAATNALIVAARALDAGELGVAAGAAPEAGFELVPLLSGSRCYWVLQPTAAAPAGQATLIYAANWQRELVIEAPHAHEDHNTDIEAATLFADVGAKALLLSGAHRCAARESSGCRPSSECDGSQRIPATSDPSHSVNNALYAMHLAFRSSGSPILQLHTNAHPEINGDALVSNGTDYAIAGTPADALYAALRAPGDVDVRTCNESGAPLTGAFCGQTSTESLASNGAADTCAGRPSAQGGAAVHSFIHLEQSNQRLCLAGGPEQSPPCLDTVDTWTARLEAAVVAAFPPAR